MDIHVLFQRYLLFLLFSPFMPAHTLLRAYKGQMLNNDYRYYRVIA